jgi:hypothetical protein
MDNPTLGVFVHHFLHFTHVGRDYMGMEKIVYVILSRAFQFIKLNEATWEAQLASLSVS